MQRYRTSTTQGHIFEFKDLLSVRLKGRDKKSLIDFLYQWDATRLYMRQEVDPMYDEQFFRLRADDLFGITKDRRDYHRLSDQIPAEFENKCYKTLRGFLDIWLGFF